MFKKLVYACIGNSELSELGVTRKIRKDKHYYWVNNFDGNQNIGLLFHDSIRNCTILPESNEILSIVLHGTSLEIDSVKVNFSFRMKGKLQSRALPIKF